MTIDRLRRAALAALDRAATPRERALVHALYAACARAVAGGYRPPSVALDVVELATDDLDTIASADDPTDAMRGVARWLTQEETT